MASTYSDLKIELIGTGEQSSTWGTTTNTNLGTAIEEAITGSEDVSFSSADVTLTLTDTNTSQAARNLRLNLTGTSGGARVLTVPAIEKIYIVNNGLADAVTVTASGGTGIAVPAGKTMYLYIDGTNTVDAITHLSSLTLATDLAVADGGTGASDASTARTNLGCGTMATQNATSISVSGGTITGGTITGITDLAVADGGTGASTASGARANLGLGALSTLNTVDTAQIDNDAITTAKILAANVTNAKMAANSVDTTQIVDDAVTSAKIDANAVDANALNVSGNGTSGQVLSSDGDGSFSWVNNVSGTNSTNGYIAFSNGLKINWGFSTIGSNRSASFNFTSAYSSAAYNVQTTASLSGVFNSDPLGIIARSTTNFTVSNSNAFTFDFYWVAIGV